MILWLFAIMGIGFSSPLGGNAAVSALPPTLPMAFAVLETDSDAPSKEYCLSDREDEREGEVEGDGNDGKMVRTHLTYPPSGRLACSFVGFPIANCWAMGLGPAAYVPFLRC